MMKLIAPYRMAAIGLAALALVVVVSIGWWRGNVVLRETISDAVRTAVAERDAHWRAEIERSNAEAERARAVQAINAAAADGVTQAQIAALKSELETLEAANAALPDGDACGLGADRVRLLNR